MFANYNCDISHEAIENRDALLKTRLWEPNGSHLLSVNHLSDQSYLSYYVFSDANKNITEYIDSEGLVQAHYEYSPFGKITFSSGSNLDAFDFRFSSEYFDSETGLVYYNYRYYSPELGRWLSRDPVVEEGESHNLYTHCFNSLLIYFDYLGLFLVSTGGIVHETERFDPNSQYWNPPPDMSRNLSVKTSPANSGVLDIARGLYNEWTNALKELQKAKSDMEKANVKGADKYFHCMGSCNAARSGSRRASDTLGRLRELEELTRQRILWHLKRYGIELGGSLKVKTIEDPQTGQRRELLPVEHAKDSLEDYEANKVGFDCPPEKTCEECCCKYKVKGL